MPYLLVVGQYEELLRKIFRCDANGHIEFGMAHSIGPANGIEALVNRIEFRDYIMEGFVKYFLRVVPVANGLQLEIELTGMNRDKYVLSGVQAYISWAGLSSVVTSGA